MWFILQVQCPLRCFAFSIHFGFLFLYAQRLVCCLRSSQPFSPQPFLSLPWSLLPFAVSLLSACTSLTPPPPIPPSVTCRSVSQDMKCVGMQYLEALRVLKAQGIKLKRTVHLSFVPGTDDDWNGPEGWETQSLFLVVRSWLYTCVQTHYVQTSFYLLQLVRYLSIKVTKPDRPFL